MNLDQHSDILNAYLSRLALTDLRQILAAAEYSQQAQLNHGISEQLRRQTEMRQTVRDAVNGLIKYDCDLIAKVVIKVCGEGKL